VAEEKPEKKKLDLTRRAMPKQNPWERIKNFDEVAIGYRLEDALVEAQRCLDCADQPCVRGCPVGIDIPGDGGAFLRRCCKMATGAGKTIVMAMVIAWQILNKVTYPRTPASRRTCWSSRRV